MTKQKIVALLSAVVFVILAIAIIIFDRKIGVIYSQTYHSSMGVMILQNERLLTPCMTERVTLVITEEHVTLSVNGDKLSGTPVRLSENGELLVQISPERSFTIQRILPPGAEDIKENELLLVRMENVIIILSTHYTCEEITRFLDEK